MQYVRCVNNETYFAVDQGDTFHDLALGQIYKVLPVADSERKGSMIRIVDDSGTAYLYPESYFEPVDLNTQQNDALRPMTVHVPAHVKGILHAEAVAADKSVSALVREWIEERLDLPNGTQCVIHHP
jgi:hypothetical protein